MIGTEETSAPGEAIVFTGHMETGCCQRGGPMVSSILLISGQGGNTRERKWAGGGKENPLA